ncbi:MAG: xanthine dehydrogenase family protein molybdopterin-binding subunit, partial [Candidatus Methylomirabilaceae bacterium]
RTLMAVGWSAPRVDGAAKVTGEAQFVSDLVIPGMAESRILRSPRPHGRIARIDTSQAARLPGVLAVLSGGDLADLDPYYGAAFKDQPILAIDRVRYEGEPVAAVAAEDAGTAMEALDLIEVEYEDLPAVTTLEEALAAGAPLVHQRFRPAGHFHDLRVLNPEEGTNICHHARYRRGDGTDGFAAADLVVEDVFTFPAVQHVSLESFVSVARWDGGGLTVWSGTQHPFPVRKELAEIFGLGHHQVRVLVPLIGGAFGQKCYTKIEPLAAALARRAGRPVRVQLSLTEAFYTLSRHPARIHIRTGVRRDGTLVAREAQVWLDTGAYADVGPRVANKAGYRIIGPYRWRHLQVDAYAVHTNRVPAGAFRGYGTPQAAWAGESQIDRIAELLSIDPLELRTRNLLAHGDEYSPGDTPMDGDLRQSLRRAAAAVGWSTPLPRGHGRGVAMALKDGGGTHTVSTALVRLHADGTATVFAGSVEIGQGAHTVLAQIAAQVLALPLGRVRVHEPDTGTTPYDQGTSASRSTTLTGYAVQQAAAEVRAQLVALAQKFFEAPPEVIALANGVARASGRSANYGELLAHHFGMRGGELAGRGTFQPGVFVGPPDATASFWEGGAGAAEVAVDEETGEIRLVKYASVADVGRAINPVLCEGQDEGAAMQGIGHTLFEEMVFQGGQLLNPNLIDYRVPLLSDLPEVFTSSLVENGDGPGPFGAKGVGESGIIAPAPALAAAVAVAAGIRLRELPLTPERIWRALQARRLGEPAQGVHGSLQGRI